MKINIDKELEEAHKQYEDEKKGIIGDLFTLNMAIGDLAMIEAPITEEHFNEFSKIIARTSEFILRKEI